jgi:capsular polysaccharide biosynthesis protein
VLGHWYVIALFVLAAFGAVMVIHLSEPATYTASTRLVLDAPAPQSVGEAQALSDGAKAIVTSPSHIVTALKAAGVARDPVEVEKNIALVPVGTSGVLQLSVTDTSPMVSAAITNALADDLIQTRLAVSPAARIASLDSRINTLNDRITTIDQQIATLEGQLAGISVNPSDANTAAVQAQILDDRIAAYTSERAALTQEELQLESERNNLISSGSESTPSVIDRATPPTHPDPSRLPIDLALALVIGLVLGTAAASMLEIFGPSLSGADAIASTLGLPVLGTLPDEDGTLVDRLTLGARAADVGAIELVAMGHIQGLSSLAKALSATGLSVFTIEGAADRADSAPSGPSALVIVAPERVRKSAIAPVKNLLAASERPVLGLLVNARRRVRIDDGRSVDLGPRLEVVAQRQAETRDGMSKEILSDLWGAR